MSLSPIDAPLHIMTASEGINVAPAGGERLYFYKDYYALVVRASNCDNWPQFPNAVIEPEEERRQ